MIDSGTWPTPLNGWFLVVLIAFGWGMMTSPRGFNVTSMGSLNGTPAIVNEIRCFFRNTQSIERGLVNDNVQFREVRLLNEENED